MRYSGSRFTHLRKRRIRLNFGRNRHLGIWFVLVERELLVSCDLWPAGEVSGNDEKPFGNLKLEKTRNYKDYAVISITIVVKNAFGRGKNFLFQTFCANVHYLLRKYWHCAHANTAFRRCGANQGRSQIGITSVQEFAYVFNDHVRVESVD